MEFVCRLHLPTEPLVWQRDKQVLGLLLRFTDKYDAAACYTGKMTHLCVQLVHRHRLPSPSEQTTTVALFLPLRIHSNHYVRKFLRLNQVEHWTSFSPHVPGASRWSFGLPVRWTFSGQYPLTAPAGVSSPDRLIKLLRCFCSYTLQSNAG